MCKSQIVNNEKPIFQNYISLVSLGGKYYRMLEK